VQPAARALEDCFAMRPALEEQVWQTSGCQDLLDLVALTHFGIESLMKVGPLIPGLFRTALFPGAFHVVVSALG
jgi:hypothetical protein